MQETLPNTMSGHRADGHTKTTKALRYVIRMSQTSCLGQTKLPASRGSTSDRLRAGNRGANPRRLGKGGQVAADSLAPPEKSPATVGIVLSF